MGIVLVPKTKIRPTQCLLGELTSFLGPLALLEKYPKGYQCTQCTRVYQFECREEKSVQTADTREIARSTSNDANKTRNKPLSDTRVLIARVPKSGHARPLSRVSHFFVSVIR